MKLSTRYRFDEGPARAAVGGFPYKHADLATIWAKERAACEAVAEYVELVINAAPAGADNAKPGPDRDDEVTSNGS